MNTITIFLRRLIMKCIGAFRKFMEGRYGSDKLNNMLVYIAFGLFILSLFIPWALGDWVLMICYYTLVVVVLLRMLSRNTYKRYQENRKYLRFMERLKDKEHRHFDCPRCRQPVRVPRGKGKIAITCPKCGEKFIKKT
jgi:hypothetical protein